MIATIYDRLRALLAEFDPEGKGDPRYKPSSDPFSFDLSPRTESPCRSGPTRTAHS